ncbi:molybdopterin molybdotransferase MoeA [Dactylosporangium matsuzakiense]|uniref:molybdopterin molybdotransferase MoeA n=1 Tax=Dactylosporangium matsuzakiense TaxID=53360 RepID=UPI0021C319EA|nr:molybdopterin molybdotransferase MoeA [Dactylosporangium matsuzakiense]UWZ48588.1 molybdopterin molybdotransferase MoeA [Dactylosporangium matsuzakiense]
MTAATTARPPQRAAADPAWAAAHATARAAAHPLAPRPVPILEAAGLILAAPLVAQSAAPAADTAAMDGYAVAGPGPWRLTGRRLAGERAPAPALAAGRAVEIATGATVPAGTDAVLPYEDSAVDGGFVTGTPGRPHIRRAGEHGRPGDLLLPAGRPVTPVAVAAALQFGVAEAPVVPRPRVALLITGDEVVLTGSPGPGQVRDVFAPLVDALVVRCGGAPAAARLVPDDRDALRTALRTAGAHVVVVSGASSAGAADHLHAVLDRLGAVWLVDGVACRPGHPQGLAALPDGRWVVSLPGNPGAGLVAALTLLEPLVTALAGRPEPPPHTAPVTGALRRRPGCTHIVPVTVAGGGPARIVPGAGSAGLRAVAAADALAVIDDTWQPGAPARLLTLP